MATPSTTASTTHSYTGGCHCGHNRFKVTFDKPLDCEESSVIVCNCSICSKNAYMLAFVDEVPSKFEWENGSFDDLKQYKFGKGRIAHYFCPTCGTSVAARGEDESSRKVGVNVSVSQGACN
jgi:hypothetical protein